MLLGATLHSSSGARHVETVDVQLGVRGLWQVAPGHHPPPPVGFVPPPFPPVCLQFHQPPHVISFVVTWPSGMGWGPHGFARAAVTKSHHLGGLNDIFSPSPGGGKSETGVSAGPVPPGASLLGMQTAVFFPCPHVLIPLHVCVLVSPPCKGTSQIGLGPAPVTSF